MPIEKYVFLRVNCVDYKQKKILLTKNLFIMKKILFILSLLLSVAFLYAQKSSQSFGATNDFSSGKSEMLQTVSKSIENNELLKNVSPAEREQAQKTAVVSSPNMVISNPATPPQGGTRAVVLNESFSSPSLPAGWTTLDVDGDGYTWQFTMTNQGCGDIYPEGHGDTYCINSASYYNCIDALTPDNWLITPQLQLGGITDISYWVKAFDAAYPQDHYGVYISTTNTNPSSFTLLFEETLTAAQADWTQRTITNISQTGPCYIAFRHFNCTDWYVMLLDDVVVNTIAGTPCNPVSNLNANVVANDVTLTWTATGAPTGYEIFFDGASIGNSTTTTFTHVGAPDGIHTYCVEASYANGCTPISTCTSAIVGNICPIKVVLTDSYGDGWNGAILRVRADGVNYADLTIASGASYTGTFLFSAGTVLEFIWVTGGSYPGECSFVVLDMYGDLLYASPIGISATAGTVLFTHIQECSCTNPVKDLQVEYSEDCDAVLTWSSSKVLWDNTDIGMGTSGLISCYWSGNDNWIVTADDFDANGPWIINTIRAKGFVSAGVTPPTKMSVVIYTNDGGQPGTEIYRNNAISIASATDPVIILPTPFTLPGAGKYWISIAGAFDASVSTNAGISSYRWNIYYGATPVGLNYQLNDKLALIAGPAGAWQDASTLVAGSYSMYFTVEGDPNDGAADIPPHNIYRDGALIAENVVAYTYTDDRVNFDVTAPHTWTVTVVCGDGEESFSKSITAGFCKNGFELECEETPIIGAGSANNFTIPVNNYYNRSFTQQIILASEINLPPGTLINAIYFQYMNTAALNVTNKTFYLTHTTKSTFTGTADHIIPAASDLIYTGPMTATPASWCTVTFDAPFLYTGGNLVLTALNNQGNYPGSAYTFRTYPTTNRCKHIQTDSQLTMSIDNFTVATWSMLAYNNVVKFLICDRFYTLNPNDIYGDGVVVTLAPNPVPEGEDATVTIDINDDCHYISRITIDGVDYGPIPPTPFNIVFYNVNDLLPLIIIETEVIEYDILASSGANGTITPDGLNPVDCGENQYFAFLPDYGYVVDYFTVDGVAKPKAYNYNFVNVHDDHSIYVAFKVAPYYITFTHTGNGEVIPVGREDEIPAGIIFTDDGDMQQFMFVPDPNWEIQGVYIDGVLNTGATLSGSYWFLNIHSSHTVNVIFKLIDINIIATAGSNGTITPSGTVPVPYGTDKTFTICAHTGYVIDQILVNGAPITVPAQTICYDYLFTNVTVSQTIHATFTKATYIIDVTTCAHGHADYEGSIPVLHNDILKITFYPDEGYEVSEVLVDGASYPQAIETGSYTFYYITEHHTLDICFAKMTYPVTAGVNAHAYFTVGALGTTMVPHGNDITYEYVAMPGYEITNVFIDGYDMPSAVVAGTYTFENVVAPHTIDVITAEITYAINAFAGTGGYITPAGAIMVTHGHSQTFTITTAPGYEIDEVLVDGMVNGDAATNSAYTFMNVVAEHTIEVYFKLLRFQMKAIANPNGSISPEGITEVNYGEDMIYYITPEDGYQISFVLVNGSNMGTINTHTFFAIEEDGTIEAFFQIMDPNSIVDPLNNVSIYSNENTVYVVNNNHLFINDITIVDMFGRVVWQGATYEKPITLNVATGIYTVRVTTDKEVTATKVSIVR